MKILSQNLPVHVGKQSHMKLDKPSIHNPLTQGLEAHTSRVTVNNPNRLIYISKNKQGKRIYCCNLLE